MSQLVGKSYFKNTLIQTRPIELKSMGLRMGGKHISELNQFSSNMFPFLLSDLSGVIVLVEAILQPPPCNLVSFSWEAVLLLQEYILGQWPV